MVWVTIWKTSKWIYIVTTAPLLVVGIGFIVSGLIASPGALNDDGYPLNTFYYFIGGAFILFPLITTLGVILFYKRINDREISLIQNGIQGEAEILNREQTGTYINELPQIKFQLRLSLPDREPYVVDYKDLVSMLDMGVINVGAKLPVYVDPNNERNILLMYSLEDGIG